MDAIMTQLNKQMTEKVRSSVVSPDSQGGATPGVSKFDQTFNQKILERFSADSPTAKGDVTAISAKDVHVETKTIESNLKTTSPKEKGYEMFTSMNRDLVNLDATIDALSAPGVKLSPRQLLAMQAGVANTSMMAETFSRFTDSVARGIQTVIQTQV